MEIIIILIIILILFGGWRLPKVSKSIGRTIGYLKKAATETKDEEVKAKEEEPEKDEKKGKEQ